MLFLFKNPMQQNAIPVLDGVRGIACFSVISYHVHYFIGRTFDLNLILGPLASGLAMAGWSGVTLFFLLSGFLLFLPYAKSLLFARPWPSSRTFYLRRALRILPGYYIALALLVLCAHPEYLRPDHLKDLGLFLTFLMDSTSSTYQKIDGPFWTLAIEWQYYMLLPLFALGFRWLVQYGKSLQQRFWLLVAGLCAMIAWGLATRAFGHYYMEHTTETFLVPRPVLNVFLWCTYGMSGKYYEDFAVGMLISTCYIASRNVAVGNRISLYLSKYSTWLWGAGIVLLFLMSTWWSYLPFSLFAPLIGAHAWLTELGYALGFGLCMTALLFGFRALKRPFEWEPLRWLGSISYSLYIWHVPFLLFFMDMILSSLPHQRFLVTYGLYWLYVFVLIVPFSYLFYRLVEVPWIQLAHKNRRKEAEKATLRSKVA